MRALFQTHRTEVLANKSISEEGILGAKYLHEFDREYQCATWGYPSEGAYYRDASSADSILAVRIPTLVLHARDDPIAFDEAVPYEEIRRNPWVVLCTTSGGGHLSWFELGGGRWHAKPVSQVKRIFWSMMLMVACIGDRVSECNGAGGEFRQDRGAGVSDIWAGWWAQNAVCV